MWVDSLSLSLFKEKTRYTVRSMRLTKWDQWKYILSSSLDTMNGSIQIETDPVQNLIFIVFMCTGRCKEFDILILFWILETARLDICVLCYVFHVNIDMCFSPSQRMKTSGSLYMIENSLLMYQYWRLIPQSFRIALVFPFHWRLSAFFWSIQEFRICLCFVYRSFRLRFRSTDVQCITMTVFKRKSLHDNIAFLHYAYRALHDFSDIEDMHQDQVQV